MRLTNKRFHVSRDVIFHEDIFPFTQHQDNSFSLPVPPSTFVHDYPPTHTTTILVSKSTETNTHTQHAITTTRP